MNADSVARVLRSMFSKQFAMWTVVFVPAFALAVTVLGALELPTIAVFVAGMLFAEVTGRIVGWFSDWYLVEKEVEEYAA